MAWISVCWCSHLGDSSCRDLGLQCQVAARVHRIEAFITKWSHRWTDPECRRSDCRYIRIVQSLIFAASKWIDCHHPRSSHLGERTKSTQDPQRAPIVPHLRSHGLCLAGSRRDPCSVGNRRRSCRRNLGSITSRSYSRLHRNDGVRDWTKSAAGVLRHEDPLQSVSHAVVPDASQYRLPATSRVGDPCVRRLLETSVADSARLGSDGAGSGDPIRSQYCSFDLETNE